MLINDHIQRALAAERHEAFIGQAQLHARAEQARPRRMRRLRSAGRLLRRRHTGSSVQATSRTGPAIDPVGARG